MADTNQTIQNQNDRFRQGDEDIPGQWVFTANLVAHIAEIQSDALAVHKIIADYSSFTEENDPWHQHDFGLFDLDGRKCYWKIDYYNTDLTGGSEDPSDLTQRVGFSCFRTQFQHEYQPKKGLV